MIHITNTCALRDWEISYTASRASGPGGQHVNTTATRVTLWFDAANSPSLNERQRALILKRLAHRINKQGLLQVSAQSERSQAANKDEVLDRFVRILRQALFVQRPRKATRIPRGAVARRASDKKRHSRKKADRQWRPDDD